MTERKVFSVPGPLMLVVLLVITATGGFLIWSSVEPATYQASASVDPGPLAIGAIAVLLGLFGFLGFYLVFPNEAKVFTLLGRYFGTQRDDGWHWTVPLPIVLRERVSLRVQNFDSQTLKVNDAVGNPIEVAAVIVWRVKDTAKAVFSVEDYEEFVKIQTETAVRHMTSEYPYDTYEAGRYSLRANADEVTTSLHGELQQQLELAGVEVIRTQLRRLAYAPEIAADMLRRQQAEAVVAARERIVDGAVGMVEHALAMLNERNVVELDDERRAQMVANLLVVLCSEHHAQPVVNAGSLYQ